MEYSTFARVSVDIINSLITISVTTASPIDVYKLALIEVPVKVTDGSPGARVTIFSSFTVMEPSAFGVIVPIVPMSVAMDNSDEYSPYPMLFLARTLNL